MTRHRPGLFFCTFLVVAAAPLGCSLDGVGCDFRDGSVNGPEDRCQERTGVQGSPMFAGFCEGLQGESIEGGCPREDAVLGCAIESGPGGEVIDWYYAPMTREEAETNCTSDSGEIREP